MEFVRQAVVATLLVAASLVFQCAGMAFIIRWARACLGRATIGLSPWRASVLMIRFTTALIVLHITQILLWAAFYRRQCLPTWESSFYFSAATYSTVGYGDIVLPQIWRVMSPVEALTGVLMCGMSVSALFVLATKLIGAETSPSSRGKRRPNREIKRVTLSS